MTLSNGRTDTTGGIVITQPLTPQGLENVLIGGDLSKLSAADRVSYYESVCKSLGLNPLTQPFQYITLNGKLVLYARRDATDQLRSVNRVSITGLTRERYDDVYTVTARATAPDGRQDESIGAVSIAGLKGEALANAMMKAETKAKRRVTLSIVGLGWLDETEVETIPTAQVVGVDATTGEIAEPVRRPRLDDRPPPPSTINREAMDKAYDDLVAQMDKEEVPANHRMLDWTDAELIEEGRQARKRLQTARERRAAQA